MWKLSPSKLESYRAFKYDLYGTSLEDYLQQVKGVFVPSPAMALGTKIHKFFENPREYAQDFESEEIDQLTQISEMLPQGVSEFYAGLDIEDIHYNMFIDRLVGRQVHEMKIGSRFNGVDAYDVSMQWRLYLLGTGAQSVTYHCITHTEKRPMRFTYHNPFNFYPYKDMQRDVLQLSRDFIDFCIHHNVEEFIKVKERVWNLHNENAVWSPVLPINKEKSNGMA